jgi:hypothetical protein
MSAVSPRSNRIKQWKSSASRSKQYTGAMLNREADYLRISCAFHPEEKITNFCKNFECLLPLCPRCVKIHT